MTDTDTHTSPAAAEPTAKHLYDDPHATPRQFLLGVMHSRHLPLAKRMEAAERLLQIFGPNDFGPSGPPAYTVQIPDHPELKIH
jgi:hypothetical protein